MWKFQIGNLCRTPDLQHDFQEDALCSCLDIFYTLMQNKVLFYLRIFCISWIMMAYFHFNAVTQIITQTTLNIKGIPLKSCITPKLHQPIALGQAKYSVI